MEIRSATPIVSISQVESNLPGEDRYCVRVTDDIYTYGVYDGHGGYLAADIACATLQDMIINEISALQIAERNDIKIASIIDAAFCACDERIISEALNLHLSCIDSILHLNSKTTGGFDKVTGPATAESTSGVDLSALIEGQQGTPKIMGRAGSCAVIVVVTSGMLFVAHVGDCRAVLIRDEHENLSDALSPGQKLEEESTDDEAKSKKQKTSFNEHDPSCFKQYDSLLKSVTSENRTGKPSKRQQSPRKDFGSVYRGFVAEGITLDHSCDIQAEADAVRHLSSDPNPMRCSDSDRKALGSRAPLRVAGSLAVTRALGDSYLKIASLSTPKYVSCIPYISCKPSIYYRPLRPTDRSIIIASDGLWNFLKARDCARIMGKYLDERENDEVFETARRSAPSGLSPGMRDTGRLRSSFVNSSSSEHRGMGFNGEGKGKSEGEGEGEDKGECEGKHSNGSEDSSSSHNGRRNVSCSRNDNSSNSDITNDSSSNSNDKNRSNNRAENTIEIECENESKDDSSGMDISPPTESSSSSSISNNNSRNITINTVETNKNHNFNHNKKDKDKDKEKKNKFAMKNKKRSAKVVWSNKNIENLNFLFTLDSHVPSEALNYFNGFLPLVTASANVVVTTTDMSNSDIESIKSNKNITDIISNIVTAANAKKEVNIIDQSCNKAAAAATVAGGGGGGGGGSEFNTRNLKNSRIVIDSPPSSSKSYSYFSHTPNDAYTKNNGKDWESVNNLDCCVDSDHSSFSVLKVACDIGNNHREGAFVSHHIVRKECSPSLEEHSSSPDRILQIQAKACAGLESKFSKRDDTPGKGVNLRGYDDRNFDPGYFERKNKERRAKRTIYPSILKEKNESEERGDSFSGDFLFEYYESRAADSSSSRCAGMKISINDGPALTLMDKCLDVAASNSKMYSCGKELRKVPQGPARRREVDDITILVVTFR